MNSLIDRSLRPGQSSPHDVRTDLLWLLGLACVAIATGIGLRDPWPADEPRFALIARDMVASRQWLIPQVGGDLYADKPPLFFWLMAVAISITRSVRWSFLLPSLLAATGSVILIYDLARRLWSREIGFAAGLVLLFSLQFVWQARQAQIDATLCFFTTLSLYGLLRHCLLGPHWKWYTIGWAAAGLGIITKGVGFLPLLVLIPFALARNTAWRPRTRTGRDWRWLLGPLALALAASVWLAPMLIASASDPALASYRNEILFGQTITRYAAAWHHHEPFWYFVTAVIPGLWLPLTVLLPWLVPYWRQTLRERDLRILLPLTWVVLVVLFFSASAGKRGVYVLPALPGFVLASAPFLSAIARRIAAQRVLFALACVFAFLGLAGGAYLLWDPTQRLRLADLYDIDAVLPLLCFGIAAAVTCLACRVSKGFLAYGLVLIEALWLVSFVVNPMMNARRSGADFMSRVEALVPPDAELGAVAYKEQYLLSASRPLTNFGHARWRDVEQEAADAALWLSQDRNRVALVDASARELCFAKTTALDAGDANREHWFLVQGQPDPDCVARGNAGSAIVYDPGKALNYSQK